MSETEMINRLNELPRIPALLQELLELVNQGDVDFGLLAQKIAMDQVISARLLRMANSAYFGGTKTISSVNDALIRVGIGAVKTLVVASVLSSVFSHVETLDMEEYWTETFEVSVMASQLAIASGLDKNDVFTIGVLHNVGELMIHSLVPQQAVKIQEKVNEGMTPFHAQEQVIETTSPALGGRLAMNWKFPNSMVDAIEHYDVPNEAQEAQKYSAVIHFARDIHHRWDTFEDEKQKALFIAEHPDSRILNISAAFVSHIDQHRGEGKQLAQQMMAA